MTGIVSRPLTVRVRLVRLVVVFAVFTGLALTLGLQCSDGMGTIGHAEMTMTNPSDDDTLAMHTIGGQAVTPVALDRSGPHDLGTMMTACLTFIFAVTGTIGTLWPIGQTSVIRKLDTAQSAVIPVVQPRAPSLAQLCVLRT